ncbi:Retrovirus-related Pol polyprotein from type-1 retrotransposable element R1 [Araneus ventricosus]|uniref:Retrovirus-related Pol polyprotein from type-1 retrotransposable element R1 n=1 Tax=Araneus ventricosus TaxID=182803 RepID=A0A4Y1ZQN3_ARAVE|nr:Retrovirus-related Pol polyprotein from type-1 retrotransposable element R1 [Araneus ventricosus]
MGCPYGSVISPCLWNIYINPILNLNSENFLVQAFSDDLALVSTGRTRSELERNINEILKNIMENLTFLRLKLSVDKCQAITIRSKQIFKRHRTDQIVFNRSPCFKINNKGIKVSNSLKYLGSNIDNRLAWTAHIMTLHSKIFDLTQNFNRIVQSDFSTDKHILKTWYFVVDEKALLCGAGVWSGSLNTENIKRLTTIQRVFLLKFLKVYRTTSTQVLGVLAEIPPPYLSAKAEFQKFQDCVCRYSELDRVLNVSELDHFVNLSNVPIEF